MTVFLFRRPILAPGIASSRNFVPLAGMSAAHNDTKCGGGHRRRFRRGATVSLDWGGGHANHALTFLGRQLAHRSRTINSVRLCNSQIGKFRPNGTSSAESSRPLSPLPGTLQPGTAAVKWHWEIDRLWVNSSNVSLPTTHSPLPDSSKMPVIYNHPLPRLTTSSDSPYRPIRAAEYRWGPGPVGTGCRSYPARWWSWRSRSD